MNGHNYESIDSLYESRTGYSDVLKQVNKDDDYGMESFRNRMENDYLVMQANCFEVFGKFYKSFKLACNGNDVDFNDAYNAFKKEFHCSVNEMNSKRKVNAWLESYIKKMNGEAEKKLFITINGKSYKSVRMFCYTCKIPYVVVCTDYKKENGRRISEDFKSNKETVECWLNNYKYEKTEKVSNEERVKRNGVSVTVDGITYPTIVNACEALGISYNSYYVLKYREKKKGNDYTLQTYYNRVCKKMK